jgi:hypothetical protein
MFHSLETSVITWFGSTVRCMDIFPKLLNSVKEKCPVLNDFLPCPFNIKFSSISLRGKEFNNIN